MRRLPSIQCSFDMLYQVDTVPMIIPYWWWLLYINSKPKNLNVIPAATTVKYIVYFLSFLESQTISFKSVLRFVKLAYNYENWETFDHLLAPVLEELSGYPEHQLYVAESKVLQMLGSMASLNSSRLRRKFVMLKTEDHGETNLSKNCMWFFFEYFIHTMWSCDFTRSNYL